MKTITTTEALAAYCAYAADFPFVTVDTEFLRERTYYSKLCLVQLAVPGTDDGEDAVLVDPLADGLSLEPLYDLFRDENIVKVFHAARQDLEIFFIEAGVFPKPLFDTQVAAMVCGFGDQAGYETLVRKIVREQVDKSSRFTDWSRRPLTQAQQVYAIGDVTHLRGVYTFLKGELERTGRGAWVEEELEFLTTPTTYLIEPSEAWKRLKTRTNSGGFLAIARELARFRETHAQTRNIPRNRVYKDDALMELASTKPANMQDLGRSRLLLRDARRGDIADGILAAVKAGLGVPKDQQPKPLRTGREKLQVNPAIADMLRVLLKARCEQEKVAQKLIASAADLDAMAAGKRDVKALSGWRSKVFGDDAVMLCDGKVALVAKGQRVETIPVPHN